MKHKFESRRQGVGNVVTGAEAKEDGAQRILSAPPHRTGGAFAAL